MTAKTTATGPDFCAALSQHGTPVTAYIAGRPVVGIARKGRVLVCTQDDKDHPGSHSACDGDGHILARWPRKDPERYWEPDGAPETGEQP